ncbi:5-methylcytosine restriction system specificity protein McrC [Corynebacterium sp.]|uniref:5-methylcytosine restriction system specificity protein McrC n=1 Tax=Corynebacterium sp. TaxID=1720 RepID=UPI0028A7B5F3|nr:hypothetical protein [Corynebacterium sp.]
MSERLYLREYEKAQLPPAKLRDLTDAAAQLHTELRPTIRQFRRDARGASLGNVVGSVALPNGDVAVIEPKIPTDDWTTSVVHLLTDETRLAVTGSQHSRPSERKNDLTAAIALEYARRLDSALRKDGPILQYIQLHEVTRKWRGRLDVTSWTRTSMIDPTRFPMTRDELAILNDFSRAMSVVAGFLAKSAAGQNTASRLRKLQTEVIPGVAVPTFVNPAVARRRLPTQWGSYAPAWDIAAPILRNQFIVGNPGRSIGLEVAVEPWRLLETLLERALSVVANADNDVHLEPKTKHTILTPQYDESVELSKSFPRAVAPDGLLRQSDGQVMATFEAKYATGPKRDHVYQALATAAALESPHAFLIYPWDSPAQHYAVTGFYGRPRLLTTVGVNLFGYRRGTSDQSLATTLRNLIALHTHD